MKIKSRYVYYPATRKIRGNKTTLAGRIRKWLRRRESPDVFPIVDYYPAVYPTKR